jgi:ubiquinone/menaquinone biosynthesis C-methylase UbiE
MANSNSIKYIEHNQKVHDIVAADYNKTHVEIYNPTENIRIRGAIKDALLQVRSVIQGMPHVLDFGAGTGNLTHHLLELGAFVVAADVSLLSLSHLKKRFVGNRLLETMQLNGVDLAAFSDHSFDMVTTYSVLHHVPDYLTAVKELVRVVKPGGVIYIDHESCPNYWLPNKQYGIYRTQLARCYNPPFMKKMIRKLTLLGDCKAWKRFWDRKVHDLHPEGDIHVTQNDHIEWA